MRWSSASRACAPGVHSHRDARRIRPDRSGENPTTIVSILPVHRPALTLRHAPAVCQVRQLVWAVGTVRRLGWLRRACPNAWRFQEVRSFPLDRCPFQAASPASLGVCIRSALIGLSRDRALRSSVKLHSSLPMTARLSPHLRFA
jgi:hypothetical protein